MTLLMKKMTVKIGICPYHIFVHNICTCMLVAACKLHVVFNRSCKTYCFYL